MNNDTVQVGHHHMAEQRKVRTKLKTAYVEFCESSYMLIPDNPVIYVSVGNPRSFDR